MISATPRSLLDALDGQREDRLHRGSAAINVQQLAGDEARLVSAEENHGVADVGWQAEAPISLVQVLLFCYLRTSLPPASTGQFSIFALYSPDVLGRGGSSTGGTFRSK